MLHDDHPAFIEAPPPTNRHTGLAFMATPHPLTTTTRHSLRNSHSPEAHPHKMQPSVLKWEYQPGNLRHPQWLINPRPPPPPAAKSTTLNHGGALPHPQCL